MDTREISRLMRYKRVESSVDEPKTPFLPKKEKLWIVTLCGSRPWRDPQILDNRFAVVHTPHNTATILEIKRKGENGTAY